MTPGQEGLLERVIGANEERTNKKFRDGDKEHGDELGTKSPFWLLGAAQDEATDLPVYLHALREALVVLRCPHCDEIVF